MSRNLKLYGSPASNATQRVLFAMAEKKIEAELVPVDLLNRQQKSPEYLAKNPFGKVPVLEAGEFTLYESMAIVRYLDKEFEQHSLTPKDAKQAAWMEQWISVHYSYFSPNAGKIMYNKLFHPRIGKPVDMEVVGKAREEAANVLNVLDQALEKNQFLCGEALTLAEICFVPDLQILCLTGDEDLIRERRHVSRWWNEISQRPTWQGVFEQASAFFRG